MIDNEPNIYGKCYPIEILQIEIQQQEDTFNYRTIFQWIIIFGHIFMNGERTTNLLNLYNRMAIEMASIKRIIKFKIHNRFYIFDLFNSSN